MVIRDIILKEIRDSRGDLTIEVAVVNENDESFIAQIPSGKSVGEREVVVLPFAGATEALDTVLKHELFGKAFDSVKELDSFLLQLDPSSKKIRLGGNLMLGISLAFARGLAAEKGLALWEILRQEFFPAEEGKILPRIFSNLINGGAHAKNNLDLQE